MQDSDTIPVTIEFRFEFLVSPTTDICGPLIVHSGGLEILFSNQKKYSLLLPAKDGSGAPANIAFLVQHLCDNVMKDPRKELFVLDDTV